MATALLVNLLSFMGLSISFRPNKVKEIQLHASPRVIESNIKVVKTEQKDNEKILTKGGSPHEKG